MEKAGCSIALHLVAVLSRLHSPHTAVQVAYTMDGSLAAASAAAHCIRDRA